MNIMSHPRLKSIPILQLSETGAIFEIQVTATRTETCNRIARIPALNHLVKLTK